MSKMMIALLVLMLAPSVARADDAEDLWHTCVHEASLPVWRSIGGEPPEMRWVSRRTGEVWGGDCWMIHEVFLRGAAREHMTYGAFARAYSGRVFAPITPAEQARVRRGESLSGEGVWNRWASFLVPDGHRAPIGWVHLPWAREHTGRDAAAFALELARSIVQHTLDDVSDWGVCSGRVDDWGGRVDREHAAAIGLRRISCRVPVANDAYSRPWQDEHEPSVSDRSDSGVYRALDF